MPNSPKIVIITPETHWDREWYLPFQSYRAKLVLLFDRLLKILDEDPDFTNFTCDGQAIMLQDYLEVRPSNEEKIRKYTQSGRISIGPFFILPDEYLVSGESIIRNLMLGIKIGRNFGNVMDCAYIPDPFGHIAQLPQILSGFDLSTMMFARGLGNEFIDNELNMEFLWKSPGESSSIIAVDLVRGYGSAAYLSDKMDEKGYYKIALDRLEELVNKLNSKSCTGVIPLNNGTDHLLAQPHIPIIVRQWNELHPDKPMIQADFGVYSKKMIPAIPMDKIKSLSGELHGGRYLPILSGVFSARMWIKQENAKIQNLLEKYTEPFSALLFFLTGDQYANDNDYIWKAWEELLKNHPHDSICGCSVDEIHDIDMKTRFFNSELMGKEILKESLLHITLNVKSKFNDGNGCKYIIFNPLPWPRSEVIRIKMLSDLTQNLSLDEISNYKLVDEEDKEYKFEVYEKEIQASYTSLRRKSYEMEFFADDIPSFGYKSFFLDFENSKKVAEIATKDVLNGDNWIENKFYKIGIQSNGTFNLFDKETGQEYKNLGLFEDLGDWGDEYDFSGPGPDQIDREYSSENVKAEIETFSTSYSVSSLIKFRFELPVSIDNENNRSGRSKELISNELVIKIELFSCEKLVRIEILFNNQSKDHRFRIKFPSQIKSDSVNADGHFYVVPRSIKPPKDEEWKQKWVPTHHQNKFISVNDRSLSFTVINKGLPEYEAIQNVDGTIDFTITLLRSVEWLSRPDIPLRPGDAGPPLYTPSAQCIGEHTFELAITTDKENWINSHTYRTVECFTYPLQPLVPKSMMGANRIIDAIVLYEVPSWGLLNYERKSILPSKLSFFTINNPKISLSALKRAESGNSLIIRLVNLSNKSENDEITFYKGIKEAQIVNLNEEKPENRIKAKIQFNLNKIKVELDPFVLATIKITFF